VVDRHHNLICAQVPLSPSCVTSRKILLIGAPATRSAKSPSSTTHKLLEFQTETLPHRSLSDATRGQGVAMPRALFQLKKHGVKGNHTIRLTTIDIPPSKYRSVTARFDISYKKQKKCHSRFPSEGHHKSLFLQILFKMAHP